MTGLRIAVLLSLLATCLSACNTMEGIGRDIQSGGRAVERGADSVQKQM